MDRDDVAATQRIISGGSPQHVRGASRAATSVPFADKGH
jgi:hypothetical protein